ncbi:hypothetical protein M8C21_026573, partial [Ambrosia artemisiifolia]
RPVLYLGKLVFFTNMSSSSSYKKILRIGIDGKLYCEHNLVAPLRVAGTCTSKPGHEFYECPYALRRGDCNVFFWKEDVDNYVLRGADQRAFEVQKEKLEEEKGLLEKELACLKGKVDVYEAMLVLEDMQCYVFWGLVFKWLAVFGEVLFGTMFGCERHVC